MQIIETTIELQEHVKEHKKISFVPTMGNLHNGHLALFNVAFKKSHEMIISIFINPTQFNDQNDFRNYPRTITEDLSLIAENFPSAKVFIPTEKEIYPNSSKKNYELGSIAHELCGKFRPGHFNGVINVIDILLGMIGPSYLILGKKDYQQLCIIEKFCKIAYPEVKIISVDTVRDKNNLALSSRNNLLEDKLKAADLFQILFEASLKIKSIADIEEQTYLAKEKLLQKNWHVDYLEVKTREKLTQPNLDDKALIILAAAYFDKIRLIDNIEFCIE